MVDGIFFSGLLFSFLLHGNVPLIWLNTFFMALGQESGGPPQNSFGCSSLDASIFCVQVRSGLQSTGNIWSLPECLVGKEKHILLVVLSRSRHGFGRIDFRCCVSSCWYWKGLFWGLLMWCLLWVYKLSVHLLTTGTSSSRTVTCYTAGSDFQKKMLNVNYIISLSTFVSNKNSYRINGDTILEYAVPISMCICLLWLRELFKIGLHKEKMVCFVVEPQPLCELFIISIMVGNTFVDLMKVATKKGVCNTNCGVSLR